jgi:hypothetical protein
MPTEPRLFRKGESLYKAGEPVRFVYLLQTGLVVASDQQIVSPQLAGEEALWGASVWTHSATAVNDTRALELPIELAQAMIEGSPMLVKLFVRSVAAKQRATLVSAAEIKRENESTPCASHHVVKLFAVIYHVIEYTAAKSKDVEGELTVNWPAFKKYAQRVFLESPVRLEQAVNLLVKLGYGRLQMVKCETDPDAPDELGFVHFKNIDGIQDFFQFYRKHYYSGAAIDPASLRPQQMEFLAAIEAWNKQGKVELGGQQPDHSQAS